MRVRLVRVALFYGLGLRGPLASVFGGLWCTLGGLCFGLGLGVWPRRIVG